MSVRAPFLCLVGSPPAQNPYAHESVKLGQVYETEVGLKDLNSISSLTAKTAPPRLTLSAHE